MWFGDIEAGQQADCDAPIQGHLLAGLPGRSVPTHHTPFYGWISRPEIRILLSFTAAPHAPISNIGGPLSDITGDRYQDSIAQIDNRNRQHCSIASREI